MARRLGRETFSTNRAAMAILKRRTRLVSFRLSEDEYKILEGHCESVGARSISEFARSALQRCVAVDHHNSGDHGISRSNPFGPNAQEVVNTIRELSRALAQLISLVSADRRERPRTLSGRTVH
jgi:hypothetical protein